MTTYAAAPRTNGLAIATLVLALCGFSILPVTLGHISLNQIKRTGESGGGLAIAGLVIGYLTIAAIVLLLLFIAVPLIAVGVSGGFS